MELRRSADREIDELRSKCPVLFQHDRGHSGYIWGEYADKRAKEGARLRRSNSRCFHLLPRTFWEELAADPVESWLPDEYHTVDNLEREVPLPPDGACWTQPKEGWQSWCQSNWGRRCAYRAKTGKGTPHNLPPTELWRLASPVIDAFYRGLFGRVATIGAIAADCKRSWISW